MERQSRKRRMLSNFFVLKPIGFVIFLLFGIIAFAIVGSRVKIPVYTTMQTTVEKEGEHIKVKLGEGELLPDTPVFIYRSRDEYLEKIMEYQVKDGYIVTEAPNDLSDKETVNIDVQTTEISLLKHIFINGGNTKQ